MFHISLGQDILINGLPAPIRLHDDPSDTHIRRGSNTDMYYKNLPEWLVEKFPMKGTRNFNLRDDPQILYLPRDTNVYLLRKTNWNGVDLSCWTHTLDEGNYWGNDQEILKQIYSITLAPGIYNLHVTKALYLFEELEEFPDAAGLSDGTYTEIE